MAARISKDDLEEKAIKSKIPVIVDFYSDSCIACKMLAPVLGGIGDDYEDRIAVYKVNTNFEQELAAQYGIMSIPTLILFKNGEAVDRKVGVQTADALKAWVEDNL